MSLFEASNLPAKRTETVRTVDELRSRLTITVPEAGDVLGIGRRQAYEAAKNGTLPVLHVGGRILVKTHELLDMLGA